MSKEILAHLVGDYVLQSHWEATQKVNSNLPAATHAAKYTLAFVPVTRNWKALAVIGATHYVIDRYRLAKQLTWLKNQAVPAEHRYEYDLSNNGFPEGVPPWLSTWLMIILDNTVHMVINHAAIEVFDD